MTTTGLPKLGDTRWRPLTVDDAAAMSDLQQDCFAVDGGYRSTAIEMRQEFGRFGDDAATDSIGAFNADGRLLALGWVQVPDGGATEHRGFVWMEIDPGLRGLVDDALLSWLEAAGSHRLRSFGDGLPLGLYRYEVYESMEDVIALMERHGFEAVRYFTENLRDLAQPIEPRPLPEGIIAQSWSERAGADALGLHNAAFADHWGSQPQGEDSWESYTTGSEFFEPDTSWVAYDRAVPVAYVKSGTYPHDFEDRARTESWIEGVGTLPSYRGRGIASALITMAMLGYRANGMDFACLGVDSQNTTGANRIYERLGFIPEKRSITFKRVIEP